MNALRDKLIASIIQAGNDYDDRVRGGVGRGWADDRAADWIAGAVLNALKECGIELPENTGNPTDSGIIEETK